MNKITSFNYIGGKSHLLSKIYEIMPPHSTYLEPFAGGASVLMNMPPSASEREVINDINNDIVDFFQIVKDKDKFEELKHQLVNTPYSRGLYFDTLHFWRCGWRPNDKIEKVAIWYFLQQSSFSGKFGAGFSTARFESNSANGFANAVDRLGRVRDRLRRVYIDNRDYQEVLEYYDKEDMLCYCDPPYWIEAADNYYRAGQNFNHYRLAEVLKKLKGKVILSYYPHPELDELYPGPRWTKESFEVPKYSFGANVNGEETGERPIGIEMLITNFKRLPLFGQDVEKTDVK